MSSFTFLFIVLLAATVQAQRLSQVVQTDKGPVQGTIEQTVWNSVPYSRFLGIPYAQPPIGPLRFRDPIPALPWTDVLRATNNLIYCPQVFTLSATGQEDCLYLNVYVPAEYVLNITTPKAVMVYIFGGGFTTGWSFPGVYGPDYILENDVIMVSFNYRVDIFGFFTLDVDGVKGNAALWDQILAMKWVKNNIAAFGGDPNQITLFGESAGAVSVSYHLTSAESAGLFNKVILQSSTNLCSWGFHTRPEAIQNTIKVANALGFFSSNQTAILEFLQNQTPYDLLMTTRFQGQYLLPVPLYFPFVPTETDDLVDDCPIEKYRTGNFSKVPILLGFNHDEAVLFALDVDFVKNLLSITVQTMANLNPLGGSAWSLFANTLLNATEEEIIKWSNIIYFFAPVDMTQKYLALNNPNPVYYYLLSHDSPYLLHYLMDNNIKGVAHADDLGLIFNINIISNNDPIDPLNIFRKNLVLLWTNFAKYSDPTPNNQPVNGAVWNPSGTQGLQLNINGTFSMIPRYADADTLAWEKLYDQVLPYLTLCKNPLALAPLGLTF